MSNYEEKVKALKAHHEELLTISMESGIGAAIVTLL